MGDSGGGDPEIVGRASAGLPRALPHVPSSMPLVLYLAGTFAFLIYDSLSLRLVEVYPDDWSRLEFLAVIDKTYLLERSADMINWEPAPFGLWQDRTTLSADWTAPDTVLQTVQAPPGNGGRRWFYKLTVH